MKTSVKSKKQIALLSAGALLSLGIAATAGGLTASAAETWKNGQSSTTVTFTQNNSWEIEIPASIDLSGEGVYDVKATGVDIEADKTLKVKVNSQNNWSVQGEEGGSMAYTLKAASDEDGLAAAGVVTQNGEVLSVAGSATEGSAKLKAELTGGKKSTGGNAYTDILTFSTSVE